MAFFTNISIAQNNSRYTAAIVGKYMDISVFNVSMWLFSGSASGLLTLYSIGYATRSYTNTHNSSIYH